MKKVSGVRALVAAPLLALACFAISASGAGAAAPTGMRVLAAKPLIPRGATPLGAVSPTTTVSGAVVLQPRDDAALTRFISQVTDKHSPLFHQYLTPRSFAARFGPAPSTIATVKSQLEASGLTVTNVARDGLILDFQAPASRVETTFRTGLERYKLANGSVAHARTAPVQVPAAIAKYVTSVVGLDTTVRLRPSSVLRAPKAARGTYPSAAAPKAFTHPAGSPTPCSDALNIAEEFGGLTDDQIANAYGVFGLFDASDFGAGQNIAVYELEPFDMNDLKTFDTCYFGASQAASMLARVSVKNVDGGQPAGAGFGESILDIENVSAFAPGANIDVYQAPINTFGSLDEYAQIVNDDADQIVTTSWGICEQGLQEGSPGIQQAENLIFQEAAAQGQTIFSAAGDAGSNDCNFFQTATPQDPVLSVDDPSSQPYVVAAGGTTINDATQPANEQVWNDGAVGGAGGGGISESWPMPAWQSAPMVPGGAASTRDQNAVSAAETFQGTNFCLDDNSAGADEAACRQLPDVSADSDEFTGGITVFSNDAYGGWNTLGGTSSAAPLWAAMLADVNASSTCTNNPATQDGVGFASPLLYAVASNPTAYAASFNDITAGNNDPYGDSNLFQATPGFDMATGLGSPQLTAPGGGAGLAFYLCNQAPAATMPTVTQLAPAIAFTSDSSTSVTITGSNFQDNANPVVGVTIGDYSVPSPDFNVSDGNKITATFPAAAKVIPPHDQTDGAGRLQVTVTLQNGETSAANINSWFTYVDDNGSSQPRPTVTSVLSYAGSEDGGNAVHVYGAGFTGATDVTFGGVSAGAANFQVNASGTMITVKVPAFQNGTTTCDQDGSTFDASQNATNDICQTQVVVTTPNGSSATSTILPLYEGSINFADNGAIITPPGDEASPAATEYDYEPNPTITSISTNQGGAASLASETGGSVVTIKGKGFNYATLDWVNFGSPASLLSQLDPFSEIVSVTGTEMEVVAPGFDNTTVGTTTLPVTVQTAAKLSNSMNATYAGVPSVTAVQVSGGPTAGSQFAPDTGGTPIRINGTGFANQAYFVGFLDVASPFSIGTQYNFTATGDTQLDTHTVAQLPSVVDTEVCTVTDCSPPSSPESDLSDVLYLFPPGDPKIDSITPDKGPASGGTKVTITGENLGCVTSISFGTVAAVDFGNQTALLDCGSTDTVTVTVPAGKAGTVPLTLHTVESDATGASPAQVSFTYTKPLAQAVKIKRLGNGRGTVTSSPKGINCPKTCSHEFAYGTAVTLKAKASPGSAFGGWSGATGCGRKATCRLRAKMPLVLTAIFTLDNCVVPNVKGKTFTNARLALKLHACSAGRITHAFSNTVSQGLVMSQNPQAGSHLQHNGKVSLTLSEGPKP
jgi:hypothetical protein